MRRGRENRRSKRPTLIFVLGTFSRGGKSLRWNFPEMGEKKKKRKVEVGYQRSINVPGRRREAFAGRAWASALVIRSRSTLGPENKQGGPCPRPAPPHPPARSAKILRGPDPGLTRSAFHLLMLKFPLLNRKLSTSGVLTCYTVIT